MVAWLLLLVQGAIVVASLLGYGLFGLRPERLANLSPSGLAFFGWAFSGLAILNMAVGGAAVLVEALRKNGTALILPFVFIYLISLISELVGTTYGIPFGAYSYTDLLGPKWFDRVPILIPLSWFMMSWPAWVLARTQTTGLLAIIVGAMFLTAWDLVLDPAMSSVTQYWVWGTQGQYYGMPWTNLIGWMVTGVILLSVLQRLAPSPNGSIRFAFAAYAVNVSLPLGFCVLGGYWVAVLGGAVSLFITLAILAVQLNQVPRMRVTSPQSRYGA